MHVINVAVTLKSQHVQDFLKEIERHRGEIARHEPGCLVFDLCQDKSDPNTFILYEVYADDAALERHRNSASLKQYFETTKDWAVSRTVRNAVRKATLR